MYKFNVNFSDLSSIIDDICEISSSQNAPIYKNPFEITFPGIVKESINIKTITYGRIGEYTKFIITGKDKKGKDQKTEYICPKIDLDGCSAKYEDGILYITVKQKESKENNIKVE